MRKAPSIPNPASSLLLSVTGSELIELEVNLEEADDVCREAVRLGY